MTTSDIMAETGPRTATAPRAREAALAPAVGTAILMMAIIQVGLVVKGNAPVLDGVLIDPDGYMRLARVAQLWQEGNWFDSLVTRIGPPEGLTLHWSRPFDLLLLIGALLASPMLGFEAGLYWWGVVLGPLLQAVAVIALVWAAAPLLSRAWRCLLAFLFVAQPGIFGAFAVGRPDHHGVQVILFVLLIGLTLRLIFDPTRARAALWSGAISALAVWVSVESILPVALSIAALGLAWLFGEPRALRALVIQAISILAALLAALLIERGGGAFDSIAIDRLSLAHVAVFAVNLGFWLAMAWVARHGGAGKLAGNLIVRGGAAAVGALAGLALLWLVLPGLFADPMDSGDALYLAKHMIHIEELQPLIRFPDSPDGDWAGAVTRPLLWLGLALMAGPWLIYRIWAVPAGRVGAERLAWIYLGLGAALFLPLAARQLRWAFYPEVLLLIPYAALAGAFLDRVAARTSDQVIGVLRPLVVVALCAWFYVPAGMSASPPQTSAAIRNAASCPIRELAPLLDDPAGLGAVPKTILALIDFGPELLYRTRHSVLAIPNHRRQPGFTAGYRIMTSSDFAAAERGLRAAGVDLVLVCPSSAESWFYNTESSAETLSQALQADNPPDYLSRVALPEPLNGQFKLYALREVSS
ncbi:MAG: hypothetical protein ACTSQ7_02110 [Alphaproteobacteria bacterium]